MEGLIPFAALIFVLWNGKDMSVKEGAGIVGAALLVGILLAQI